MNRTLELRKAIHMAQAAKDFEAPSCRMEQLLSTKESPSLDKNRKQNGNFKMLLVR